MEERKKKGLCFNCNEKYTYGHTCKHLFLMEDVEEIGGEEEGVEIIEEGEEQDLGIYVHALAGRSYIRP